MSILYDLRAKSSESGDQMKYSSTQLCNLANVSKKALRHYDKLGILSPSTIDDNGYWYYNDTDLNKLQLVRNLQVLGFSLKEIKLNLETDCSLLRKSIESKKQYLEEEILQYELAKRLLDKIESKEELDVLQAVSESIEEEHLDWYKKNLQPNQYKLVEDMFAHEDNMTDHGKLIECFQDFKTALTQKNETQINLINTQIRTIFYKYGLDDETIRFIVKAFLQSNLEGPFTQRILSVKEVVKLMSYF